MQHITVHPIRWLIAFLALASLSLGVFTTASHAGTSATPNCDLSGDIVVTDNASDAGGDLVTWVTDCTGTGTAQLPVTVSNAGVLYLKVVVEKTVNGGYRESSSLHLPPLPEVDPEICVGDTCAPL